MTGLLPPNQFHDDGATPDGVSLTKFFFHCNAPEMQAALHEFRLEYELLHGQTDKNQRYSSQEASSWQTKMQLFHPAQYIAELPPFARAFFMRLAADLMRDGGLDDLDDVYIKEFFARHKARRA